MKYYCFADLPNHVRRRIEAVAPASDLDSWVAQQLPALKGRSVLEVMEEERGEEEVLKLLRDIQGFLS